MKKIAAILYGACAAVFAVQMPSASAADLSIGVVVSTTGPGAVLGIPYRNVFGILPDKLGGRSVTYTVLDDASDVTSGVRNAKRLLDENKVDALIGSNSVPVTLAMMQLANETRVPHISLSPIDQDPKKNPWTFSVPQPIPLMMGAVVEDMVKRKVRTVGYIGFADAWGESVHKALLAREQDSGFKVTSNERYQRNDVSVTTQALKIISGKPDAVVVGGSGAPGALPHIALRERGYTGPIYNTHGSVSGDFIRIGGRSAEGAIAPAGPFLFASQLPASNVVKPVASKYLADYDKAYGPQARSPFAGYAFDAYLLLDAAVAKAVKQGEPGTPAFRKALRDALEGDVKDVVGTQGVYSMTDSDHNGLDNRARVLVQVREGKWVTIND